MRWFVCLVVMSVGAVAVAEESDPGTSLVAATQPAEEAGQAVPNVEAGLVEFWAARFSPHDPMYFVWGPEDPNAEFQISLKYQLINPDSALGDAAPWLSRFHAAYTQTSFWDIGADSGPFFDSSYKPELLYLYTKPLSQWTGLSRFDLQLGLQHESNGKAGLDSRSLNIAYVRPVFTFGDGGTGRGAFVTIAPRLWGYIGDLEENSDIADYRGYGDLRVVTGWRDGFQFAATGRLGNDWDKGLLELTASYPLRRLTGAAIDMYLFAQYTTGYGESLLDYDEHDETYRIGLALVR